MKEHHTKHVTDKIASHFVWYPPSRKALLLGEVAQVVETQIRRLCADTIWEIGALTIQEDYVHLFVSASPAISPSLIAKTLKGIPARQVFKQYPEGKKHLWGGSFWGRSYSVGTLEDMTQETIKTYIEMGQG